MRARHLLIASILIGLFPADEFAYAQSAPGEAQTLPPVVVSPTTTGVKRGRAQNAPQVVRNLRTVYVYPTTPASGSSIDVDKVPASVNFVDAKRIERTGSLNIADALLQQVPGVVVNEVAGNPFQPDVQFRGFVASPVAVSPQGLAGYHS